MKATPDDYVLLECADKETGLPYGPRGMIRSLAAALGVIHAHGGLIPPNWGHPVNSTTSNGIRAGQLANNVQAASRRPSPDVYHQQSYDRNNFAYRYAGH